MTSHWKQNRINTKNNLYLHHIALQLIEPKKNITGIEFCKIDFTV